MPSIDKTNMVSGNLITVNDIGGMADEVQTYVFKHVPITGNYTSPNTINIVPGSSNNVKIDGSVQAIADSRGKTVPSFPAAANYGALIHDVQIIPEQEEDIKIKFEDGTSFNVNGSSELTFKLYRTQIGNGYNGGSNAYCTIKISRI